MVATARNEIELTYGINRIQIEVAGFELGMVRQSIGPLLNLSRIAVANVSGVDVADSYVLLPGDRVEFFKELGKKGGDESTSTFEAYLEINRRLDRIEFQIARLLEQKAEKEWYSTTELANAMGKSLFTITEHWCNAGRIECEKDPDSGKWRIPGQEFKRLVNGGGLLPKRR